MRKQFKNGLYFRNLFLGILAFLPLMIPIQARADVDSSELKNERTLSIERIFAVPEGFDDNDNIQFVIDGNLPNICFELGKTVVKREGGNNTFSITQYVHRKKVPGCGPEGLQEELNWPVPFQKEVSLGQLPAGRYSIQYNLGTPKFQTRPLVIKESTIRNVDDMLYAPVSSAFIPEMIYETENGEAALTGILANSCLHLDQKDLQVKRYDDVIVVIPLLKIDKQSTCLPLPRPLHEIVTLGPLRPGRYLLHVRSMSGMAINRIFTVIKGLQTENISR